MIHQDEFDFEKRREAASAEVIDRIKKLLRLAAGKANLHESELALQRAFELARKYDVDVESLDLDERTRRITHEWFKFSKRASFLEIRCLQVVQTFFRVSVVGAYGKVVFIGMPTDIAIAHYVLAFIVRTGKNELKAFEIAERKARRKMSTNKRKNFLQGYIYGICSQLKKTDEEFHLDDSKTALVLAEAKARQNYCADLVPDTKVVKATIERENKSTLEKGYARGCDTKINQPLEDGDEKILALGNG